MVGGVFAQSVQFIDQFVMGSVSSDSTTDVINSVWDDIERRRRKGREEGEREEEEGRGGGGGGGEGGGGGGGRGGGGGGRGGGEGRGGRGGGEGGEREEGKEEEINLTKEKIKCIIDNHYSRLTSKLMN